MSDVAFYTDGLEAALIALGRRPDAVPMHVLGQVIQTDIDDVIQSEGAKGTKGPWAPFAESTLRSNPRRIGGQLLQDTGLLANLQIVDGQPLVVVVKSPAPYAGFHVEPTLRPGGRAVERDFLAIDLDQTLRTVGDIVLEYMGR